MESNSHASVQPGKALAPTPEILHWAKGQFSEVEIVAGFDELQRTGGLELHEFIHELEAEITPRE